MALLLIPGSAAVGGWKRFLKGVGRVVGKVLTGEASRGDDLAAAAAAQGPAVLPLEAPVAGAPCGYFLIRADVTRLILRDEVGYKTRVAVPGGAQRAYQPLFLRLPPGKYAWVGYEVERRSTHHWTEDEERREATTVRLWRDPAAFELPFELRASGLTYGGTLELTLAELSGDGAAKSKVPRYIEMPKEKVTVWARFFGDQDLAARVATDQWADSPRPSKVAARSWRDRNQESGGFADFPAFERYHRWLVRASRAPPPASWPPLVPGEPGGTVRIGIYQAWLEHVAAQPRREQNRVDLSAWVRGPAVSLAQTLLRAQGRRTEIHAFFAARRARLAAAAREAAEEARAAKEAKSWGRRSE